jgi:hypothetical protein
MVMTAAIVALALSALLLGTAITLLVMLRRGDGPVYSTSRLYDANRREAVRLLLGGEVAAPPVDQWFAAGREPILDAALETEVGEVAAEALRAVVPSDRGLVIESGGRSRVEGARVVTALSTADLRASGALEASGEPGLFVGLVLLNPEPPGGDARRVTLPVQVLFPALERAGREDLIRRFGEIRDRAAASIVMEVSS